jgi:hypothetical protein
MLYELVLITNLGVTTALATYPDFNSCLKERVQITQSHSAQFSVACLPTNSPEELEKKRAVIQAALARARARRGA